MEERKVPRHVAIILDGNGRWAKKRMLPRNAGHAAGSKNVEKICAAAWDMGIEYVTMYAFSTENWSRPQDEVKFIMNLPVEFFNKYVPELDKNNVRILTIGDNSRLPKETLDALEKAVEQTKHNSGLVLNFALNYGGRAEIVSAVQAIAKEVEAGKLSLEAIDEDLIAKHLMTDKLPYLYRDPDLIIRTSGELRLSNFLPWQSAYSEFYFTDVFWPDFDQKGLRQAISDYNKRHRRFGGV